jgi:DeoR/GlpR family transcriptional regulator of sugar metabolism
MADTPPRPADLNTGHDAKSSWRVKIKAITGNANVINGIVSGVVGAMAASLIGIIISNAAIYSRYFLIIITVIVCAAATSVTFWFCSKAVASVAQEERHSIKADPRHNEPQRIDLSIQDVSVLYDSFRDRLGQDVFSALWHRPNPSSAMPHNEIVAAVRKVNPDAYEKLDDHRLGGYIRELARIQWLPTLIYDETGFSLEGDSYDLNVAMQSTQKSAIGDTAAALIRTDMYVGLDGGTTTLQVARSLGARFSLLNRGTIRVVTSSANVVHELGQFPDANKANYEGRLVVSFLGGDLSLPGGHSDVSGAGAFQARLDVSFVGANGIDADGFYLPSSRLLQSKQILIENSTKVYIVADSTKLGRRLGVKFASWNPNIQLIMNAPSDRAQRAVFKTLPQDHIITCKPAKVQ